YTQIGLLLSIPGLASLALEPVIGVLGDLGRRRALVVAGGIGFAAALVLAAAAPSFGLLLAAFLLVFPSSGAFVSLSQATLMDLDPRSRRSEEHTSELQSRGHLVCRLLLEKKKNRHCRQSHQVNSQFRRLETC